MLPPPGPKRARLRLADLLTDRCGNFDDIYDAPKKMNSMFTGLAFFTEIPLASDAAKSVVPAISVPRVRAP